jgi:hypothetical protein
LEEEEVARRGRREGEGRREDHHLPYPIPLDPAPRVSFPILHDLIRF